MDERAALETSALRTIETRDHARALLADGDRSWASRAAAEVVGEAATAEAFVARRAALALERLSVHHPALPRAVRALRWRRWVAIATVAAAFIAGVAVDRVGGTGRIDLLAPPMFGLLLWNLAVYAALVIGYVVRYGEPARIGPLRRTVIRIAGHLQRQFAGIGSPRRPDADTMPGAIAAVTAGWAELAAPLYAARAATILHAAAATLTLGVIAGLYLRGLAFEYRATWESTFLDADAVRALLAVALAPGAWLTGLAFPEATQLAAIRAPGSENAAAWLHLIAATLAAVVVVPRLLLAAASGLLARYRAAHLPVALTDPYYQRLLRGFRGGPARVRVLPHSYTLAPSAIAGLETLVARSFGGSAALTIEAPVAYGDETGHAARDDAEGDAAVLVVFNLAATPEREVQGRFIEEVAARAAPAGALHVLIDTSVLRARWPDDPARFAARRSAWEAALPAVAGMPLYVDLAAPDVAAFEQAFDAAAAERTDCR
jgi:hypothetical protein